MTVILVSKVADKKIIIGKRRAGEEERHKWSLTKSNRPIGEYLSNLESML
jgi:hypothetical protein